MAGLLHANVATITEIIDKFSIVCQVLTPHFCCFQSNHRFQQFFLKIQHMQPIRTGLHIMLYWNDHTICKKCYNICHQLILEYLISKQTQLMIINWVHGTYICNHMSSYICNHIFWKDISSTSMSVCILCWWYNMRLPGLSLLPSF